jgi:hypothetical protein
MVFSSIGKPGLGARFDTHPPVTDNHIIHSNVIYVIKFCGKEAIIYLAEYSGSAVTGQC